MANHFRITLWSGGKAVSVHIVAEAPKMADGCLAFRTEEGSIIRLMGNISIEEGEFSETRISMRR